MPSASTILRAASVIASRVSTGRARRSARFDDHGGSGRCSLDTSLDKNTILLLERRSVREHRSEGELVTTAAAVLPAPRLAAHPLRWRILAVILAAEVMDLLDGTIVNVAAP